MKSRTFLLLAPYVTSLLAGGVLAAGDGGIIARSGPARTALLELFTSAGCSSCAPAEKWMASLLAAEGLWKDFVPVAFHVDYWAWTASNRISTLPRGRLAIAAWIARPDSPAPVQSAGGWLLPPSQS